MSATTHRLPPRARPRLVEERIQPPIRDCMPVPLRQAVDAAAVHGARHIADDGLPQALSRIPGMAEAVAGHRSKVMTDAHGRRTTACDYEAQTVYGGYRVVLARNVRTADGWDEEFEVVDHTVFATRAACERAIADRQQGLRA